MANTKTLSTRISLKYDSYTNWTTNNPVLLKGELAIASVPVGDTNNVSTSLPAVLIKVGDGVHTYNELDFIQAKAADVASWAKAATKPTYAASEITGLADYISGEIQDTDTQYQLVKVDDYNYKLQSKALDGTWVDVEGSTIVIPNDTAAIEALQALVGETAVATQIANAITTAKNELLGTDADTADSDTIKGAKKYADSLNTAMDTRVGALETAIGDGGSVSEQIDAKIQALDVTDTAVEGQYVSAVAEVDGKVVVSRENLPDYTEVYEPKGTGATEAGKVQTALNAEIERAKSAEDANATAAANAQSAADAAQADVDALEAKVGTVPDDKTVVEMIAEAQAAATYDDTALKGRVSANETAIATLNGDENTAGSVKKQVADAVAQIVSDAPESYDTLKEISDWISSHASDASAMNSQINTNKADIASLKALVGTLPEGVASTTVVDYIDEAIAALQIGDYAKASDLVAAVTRIDTAEGKITTLEGKVSTLEAVGAQANVIETVKVNGVALEVSDKAVDVTVPTGALASKDEVAETDLEAALATKINDKAEQSALDELDTYVGTIPESATAQNVIAYVDEKVAAEGVSALKDRVDTAEDKITTLEGKAHEHANEALLDTYTQTEADLADAVAKKHEHANKEELDKIVSGDKEKWDAAVQTITAGTGLTATKTGTDVAIDIDDDVTWIFDCGTSDIDN